MGKGSKPRNCFSRQFQDNFDDIDWSKKSPEREMIEDCAALYRWPEGTIINGCGDEQEEDCCEDESCANE
jgi:hypothetical protein